MPIVLLRMVQYVSTTGKTNPCTHSDTQKNISKKFNASDQAELRPNPCRTTHQAGPWFTQMQILDQPVLELNPLKIHLFYAIKMLKKKSI